MSKIYADVVAGILLPSGGKKWIKVGVMLEMGSNDKTRGPGFTILLDKTFNPAGVIGPETSVMLSTYWPKESETAKSNIPPTARRLAREAGDLDDDIPF